jgi:hypothetical protein
MTEQDIEVERDTREYFAGQALMGILAAGDKGTPEDIARFCVRLADALVKALEK